MKNIKYFLALIIMSFLLIPFSITKADITKPPATVNDLNNQIFEEIQNILQTPLYLNYTDKNLKGETYITISVIKDGKISVTDAKGENEMLNRYVIRKIESRNMWTDPAYTGKSFTFKISSR